MITIDLLKNHTGSIRRCAEIWYDVLGKIWIPETSVEQVVQRFSDHLNEDCLPITFVALEDDKPVGMCSLRENDGIRPEVSPWLGSLVVNPEHQNRNIGKMLINTTINKACELGFNKLYLFAFDRTLPNYYIRLDWGIIGVDTFKRHPVTVMEINL